ncbi:tetrahydrofolate dehydrogenase/cyclohydrolase catalytic domain-containing protein [Methanimicrococcus blatticola]|uniref:Bifunctional protein FolD n=1 Tax=Methanimicrococcus blatticola TaxID=91560 RepID=A0A484F5I6_9EURY|nr:tetrahydrofolate dehydrogenase/cyclohydrolase catalytic domain-containing protein [Methanimicrococcus blatticola]MBZ3935481.1 bifunctional methylenetetrahydrofolate dehydrogenase/methenyltetrahydrofolate cyclohydrolase [Methanimicrococcus blatticola]MCC2509124.1 bifunctional methylenetetrahydrofolate dehydrogenase/methenyltetrahydrofolate cyclohydrolase [Methanimicrococcus blatticola]TDQ69509.1 methenyltetrahydrofolate cyclohydrolase /5,10-methylenetetrahydrofolate dehydrogenase (NADP+) [Meth
MSEIDTSKIIDGKAVAAKVEAEATAAVLKLKEKGISPKLVTVLVGDNPASQMYVRMKHKACERVGILAEDSLPPVDITEAELLELIRGLNEDDSVSSILVQLPLPPHINAQTIMNAISPMKDPDGFHPFNMGNLMINEEGLVPCTPKGIIRLMEEYNVEIKGKNAVVVGHSNIVGKPMAAMLLNRDATVSVCHVFTKDLKMYTKEADILVVGTGVKHLIKEDMVKEGVAVFDAGITTDSTGTYGDVDFENVIKKASLITPVPGGVGPMTIAILMQHVIKCAEMIAETKK